MFWSVLWGGLLLSPDDNDNAAAATTVVGFRRGITDRARAVLVASIVEASAWVESAVEPRHLAAKIVPVLQSLVLGILYAEREGEGGVMLGLTGIAVRLAKGAVGALKGWIREISRSRSRSSTASCESGLETTIADSEGERSLLAQFSASFWFIAGSEIWCADLLGTPFSITDHEIACVPIAFDAANGGLLPIVGAEVVLALLNPETGAERRREILREMVGGILETGPHFLAGVQLLIEKRTIELRRRAAAELGFSDLYAARGTEVGMEATRLTGVLQEAVDALPLQIRDLEASGRISDLLALLRACPAIPESMVHLTSAAMLWNNQHQACIRSPALGIEPDDDDGWWTGDGAEAGGFAVRGARYLASLINAGCKPRPHPALLAVVSWIRSDNPFSFPPARR